MQTLEQSLSEHPFLKGLDPHHITFITGCASTIHFHDGQSIFREGEAANYFYIIRQGKVAIELFVPERGPIIIQTVGDGDVLGWSWLLPPHQWRFDARAVEPTDAIVLDGRRLRSKCEQDHDLGYELLKRFAAVIASRLESARLQILDVYSVRT
ncbi:MAG: effector domain of the CAP family transcription factor [Candidatus Jettenia ecosi]|uniref:Effector domain of the CAP family transcription factor n=1 Tax=Candidatus Jettenia ecosi TaxID=2494326 RepID=A0A533Q8L0_9BACT|nr:MAG: effector domain of the CAP family transcription factor [Candidatus Jettenia ecosi]